MADTKIPTREEFISKYKPVEFRFEPPIGWTHHESKEFQIVMPSGHTIPVSNYFESYYDKFVTSRNVLDRNFFDKLVLTYKHGLVPVFTCILAGEDYIEEDISEGGNTFDLIDNKWTWASGSSMFSKCSNHLFNYEVVRLQSENKDLKIRLAKLEQVFEHIRSKSQTIDEMMQIVEEMPK